VNRDASTSKRFSQDIVLALRQGDIDGGEHLSLSRIRHLQLCTWSMKKDCLERRPLVHQPARAPDRAHLVTE
jgi:hypothetical protein